MHVTIVGTGKMARGIGLRLAAGGHTLTIIGRDSAKSGLLAAELHASAAPFEPESITGSVVVLTVPFRVSLEVINKLAAGLAGKTVIDITNPFNQARDGTALPSDTSAAEEIQKALAGKAQVVKAFNTTFAKTLERGMVNGQLLDVFIAGDDAAAKSTVSALVISGGMNAVDVGPLARARQLEAMGILEVLMQPVLGTGHNTAWKLVLPS